MELPILPSDSALQQKTKIRVFGIGNAGLRVIEPLVSQVLEPGAFVGVNSDAPSLNASSAPEKILVESKLLPGMGIGGDPERGRAAAEEQWASFKALCEPNSVVVLVAGLGGASGTGITPVVARAARDAGAMVIVFAILPFECEGSLRMEFASAGLGRLRETAHLVICLSNQKLIALLGDGLSLVDTFKASNSILGQSLRGVFLALTNSCVMGLPFLELCKLVSQRSADCFYAMVEANGPDRAKAAVEKMLHHPLLDAGAGITDAQALAVCVISDPSLSMGEVNRIMDEINRRCQGIPVIMGACVSAQADNTLNLAVLASGSGRTSMQVDPVDRRQSSHSSMAEDLPSQLLEDKETQRPNSRFVPPAPDLPPEKMRQIITRQVAGTRARKASPKMRQGQLPLEIISKGRFDKSEPTIHKGEDLDVPTYIRRGMSLN